MYGASPRKILNKTCYFKYENYYLYRTSFKKPSFRVEYNFYFIHSYIWYIHQYNSVWLQKQNCETLYVGLPVGCVITNQKCILIYEDVYLVVCLLLIIFCGYTMLSYRVNICGSITGQVIRKIQFPEFNVKANGY